jgi:hypothetical protein
MSETGISTRSLFDDNALGNLATYADAAQMLTDAGIEAEFASDYGSGFSVVDKATLVGVPFLVIEWRFNTGSYGGSEDADGVFVSVTAVTKANDKVIFNDGSTGICAQLQMVTEGRVAKGIATDKAHAGLVCEKGLSVSQYYRNKEGTISKVPAKGFEPAATYYIAE